MLSLIEGRGKARTWQKSRYLVRKMKENSAKLLMMTIAYCATCYLLHGPALLLLSALSPIHSPRAGVKKR
jgi:hypothetical protein